MDTFDLTWILPTIGGLALIAGALLASGWTILAGFVLMIVPAMFLAITE